MNYVLTDLYNDNIRLRLMLDKIHFNKYKDHLYILGDLFDRGLYGPDPTGIYYTVLSLEDGVTFIRGNHDTWLANYIYEYYGLKEKDRAGYRKYHYNSFELLSERLVEQDMITLADRMMAAPAQIFETIDGKEYLFAHAMTSHPDNVMEDDHYLMGSGIGFPFLKNGIEGYISMCGHTPTDMVRLWYGDEHQPKKLEIWNNPKGNVYLLRSAPLGALFYVWGMEK